MERWRAVALASKGGAFPSFGVVKCRNPNEFHPGEHAGMEIVPEVIPAMPPGWKSFPAAWILSQNSILGLDFSRRRENSGAAWTIVPPGSAPPLAARPPYKRSQWDV